MSCAVPSGTWANVSIIMPNGLSIERVEGIPTLKTYEQLKEMFQTRKYKLGTYYYSFLADWRINYYREFMDKDLPPTQLCPSVWLCSSLGAFEVVKHAFDAFISCSHAGAWEQENYLTDSIYRLHPKPFPPSMI